ncbi:hypothetical protein [Enterococcus faecium]|uniref:hypothetical protein n=1 Tax=Enterococcus faecium TaxID=1352 RepID=UPI000C1932DB|nr:hypothetical protein [Enterococcus faecium]MBG0379479.1 hypothetical protein [Enterococcus faecium]MBH1040130.1 hypothetical protein [Enterococcus faecium]PJN98776.1 hypothetical protein CS913_005380 [Enterococcus faecium]PJO05906.1 hypothetical protein CS916_014195 [Enterococcus faecium]PNE97349.1 hypothetical protein CEQ09_01520 [Enterococcus faecium]
MAYSTIGVVVEKSRDNLVFVTEIQTGRAFVVTDKEAKAYQPGDLLTLDLTTKKFVDAAENYPFI